MNIVIVDNNKEYKEFLEDNIKQIIKDYNILDFDNAEQFIKWEQNNKKDIDFVFIQYIPKEACKLLKIINISFPYAIKIFIGENINEKIKKEALDNGVNLFLDEKESPYQLKAILKLLIKIRQDYKNNHLQKISIEKQIIYKEKHEKIALQKQIKIMKNDLSMFFEDNNICEIYFQPKDILSGDGIFSKYIDKNEYFITIIDAMGKGISASLTNTNSISFLHHAINKALEYKDFSFERIIKDFIDFVKTILLDKETLSIIFLYIKDNEIYYANFGMPPIYTRDKKILLNNQSIMLHTNNFKIDKIPLPDFFVAFSDGIIESLTKDKTSICYKLFKEEIKKASFLKSIISRFEKECIQTDDITLFLFKKECLNYNKIYEIEFKMSSQEVDRVLEEVYKQDIPRKDEMNFILQEILINTLEHSIIKISENKEQLIKTEGYFLPTNIVSDIKAKITIYENEEFIKISYKDQTEGFDLSKINSRLLKKYHGRGLKIIKKIAESILYNDKGNEIKIFIRK